MFCKESHHQPISFNSAWTHWEIKRGDNMVQYKKATETKATQDLQNMNFDEKSSLEAETTLGV